MHLKKSLMLGDDEMFDDDFEDLDDEYEIN